MNMTPVFKKTGRTEISNKPFISKYYITRFRIPSRECRNSENQSIKCVSGTLSCPAEKQGSRTLFNSGICLLGSAHWLCDLEQVT